MRRVVEMMRTVFCFFFIILCACEKAASEDQRLYLVTERPVQSYVNPKYLSFFNFTATRFGRRNPLYYVNIHYTTLITADNNLIASFWFYEYYSSQYRRSFLEMTYRWCNLVEKDAFFGPALRKNLPKSCPHPPGTYHLVNMTLATSAMPNVPFASGRIYLNLTMKRETVLSVHIDIELKRKKSVDPVRRGVATLQV